MSSQADESAVPGIDTSRPHPARTYNWRPDGVGPRPTLAEVSFYGGIGRKP